MVEWTWESSDAAETAALAGFTVMWDTQSMLVDKDQTSYTIPAHLLTAGTETTVSVLARAAADSDYSTPATPSAMSDPVTPVDPNALRFVDPVTGAVVTAIDNLDLIAGMAIGTTDMPYIQLPRAAGGPTQTYTYSLLKGIGETDVTDGDNGLSVDRTHLHLMGTPAKAAGAHALYMACYGCASTW